MLTVYIFICVIAFIIWVIGLLIFVHFFNLGDHNYETNTSGPFSKHNSLKLLERHESILDIKFTYFNLWTCKYLICFI